MYVSEKCGSCLPNVGGTAESFVFRPSLWMKDFFIVLFRLTNIKIYLF